MPRLNKIPSLARLGEGGSTVVLKGQFLERPALIRVGQIVLEGLAHRGHIDPPLLILSPLPDEGGGMDHVVAAEIAWATANSSHGSLRFNYRGIGASQGKKSAETHLADALGALEVLRESTNGATPAVVSIGGSARFLADLAKGSNVSGLAAISPVNVELELFMNWGTRPLVIIAEHDLRVARATVAKAISDGGGRLEVIRGTDYHFSKNLVQVGRLVVEWLESLRKNKNDDISST